MVIFNAMGISNVIETLIILDIFNSIDLLDVMGTLYSM